MAEHGAECGQCKHFLPARHDSGRINKQHYGACTASVVWPAVPICFGMTWRAPERRPVWFTTNAEDCPHHERPPR